jgi:NTE family protein
MNAFIVSGGGCKGAFAVGVAKFIREQRPAIGFGICGGTSTGALVAPLVAIGEQAVLEHVYTTTTTDRIITKGNVLSRFLEGPSLFDATPLWRLINETWTQPLYDRLMASNAIVYVTTVCLQTGEIVYWSNKALPSAAGYTVHQVASRMEWLSAVMASACQPVFMQPIAIRSTPAAPRQYCDGGMREYLPIELALRLGATDVFAIALSPAADPGTPDKAFGGAFGILETAIDWFTVDVGLSDVRIPELINRGVNRIADAKRNLLQHGVAQAVVDACFVEPPGDPFAGRSVRNIHVLRPDAPLGGGPGGLMFDPVEMTGMLHKGFQVAERYFGPPVPGDPTIV